MTLVRYRFSRYLRTRKKQKLRQKRAAALAGGKMAIAILAARYQAWTAVAGTTLGMMLAYVPVVWFGHLITRRVPIRTVHLVSAASFAVRAFSAILNGPG